MTMTMVTAGITIITVMGTATFTLTTMIMRPMRRGCSIAAPIRLVKRSPA